MYNITSKQKKLMLPLASLVVSFAAFLFTLGNWAAVLVSTFVGISFALTCKGVIDEYGATITDWFNRDGWK